jgi:putative flippase GtrA
VKVSLSPSALRAHAQTPTGKKLVKYTMVSIVSVIIGQSLLTLAFGIFRWDAVPSNVFAVGVSAIPSYYLNRAWAWGKRGRSHFLKEVLPFWGMAFLGLALSTVFVHVAEGRSADVGNRALQTAIVNGASIAAFGVLWVAKFVILNKLMFAHHEQDLEDMPALDGRTGIPT